MVSAGVCFEGKGRLHFVEEKAKVNAEYYMNNLLQKLVEDCHDLLGDDFIFQQDGTWYGYAAGEGQCRAKIRQKQTSRMPLEAKQAVEI